MFGSASDDELADVCDDIELKAKLGVGANGTLMLVVYWEEDGDPEDVAMVIANRLKKPTGRRRPRRHGHGRRGAGVRAAEVAAMKKLQRELRRAISRRQDRDHQEQSPSPSITERRDRGHVVDAELSVWLRHVRSDVKKKMRGAHEPGTVSERRGSGRFYRARELVPMDIAELCSTLLQKACR